MDFQVLTFHLYLPCNLLLIIVSPACSSEPKKAGHWWLSWWFLRSFCTINRLKGIPDLILDACHYIFISPLLSQEPQLLFYAFVSCSWGRDLRRWLWKAALWKSVHSYWLCFECYHKAATQLFSASGIWKEWSCTSNL